MTLPNKDEFRGRATKLGGKIKEGVGYTINDKALENEGKA